MKLLSLSKNTPTTTTRAATTTLARSSSWPWPAYCHQPKTLSFRGSDDLFRTINSAFLDSPVLDPREEEEGEDGYEDAEDDGSIETVIQGARSEGRLFFEPAGQTSSVLAAETEEAASGDQHVREELPEAGVAMCVVESRDPYGDFRRSMEEMVEAHALRGKWGSLEDLLRRYLRVNDRTNHGYILRAFVDLLLSSGCQETTSTESMDISECSCNFIINSSPSKGAKNINPPSTSSPCSPLSFYTSSSSCCSSSDSLSTTPCCISVIEEAEENCISNTAARQKHCLPSKLGAIEQNIKGRADDSSSSSMSSSSSSDV